jgi:hypothetical protein
MGRGYETWVGTPGGFSQPEIIEFEGALNSGDYTTGEDGFYDLQFTTGHGLNLISNPYPSAIEADIDNWSKRFVSNAVWIWSHTNGNYVYWNGTNGDNGSGWGTMTGGIIPAMQGFFVQTTRNNSNLTIPQSDRIHSNQEFYKESSIPANTLKLEVEANEYTDVIFVNFNEAASEEFDLEYDVRKLFGLPEAPQLYSRIFNEQLSINSLPGLEDSRMVQLGFECGLPGFYSIHASEFESFAESVSVFIEDTKNGSLQNLSDNPVYQFDYDISDEAGRFVLHFGGPIGVKELSTEIISIYAEEKVVYIRKSSELLGEIAIYDMLGQKIVSQSINDSELQRITIGNGTGYYIVKVQSGKSLMTQKVFIR